MLNFFNIFKINEAELPSLPRSLGWYENVKNLTEPPNVNPHASHIPVLQEVCEEEARSGFIDNVDEVLSGRLTLEVSSCSVHPAMVAANISPPLSLTLSHLFALPASKILSPL